MKQFKVVIPKSKASAFAAYAYANEIRVVLSWAEESDFFSLSSNSAGVYAECIAKEETTTTLMASEWKSFVKS